MRINSLVSVIVPVYNGERFLAQAIQSVLSQNYRSIEIIVVDDGSTDGSTKVCETFGSFVRYLYQTNAGTPAARNRGIQVATGEFLGFVDQDDLWIEERLSLQLHLLRQNPSVGIVQGHLQLVRTAQNHLGEPTLELYERPHAANNLGSALFRRSVFDRVGLLDETQRFGDDADWFLRAKELGVTILLHDEVVLHYRRHEGNLTNQKHVDDHFFMLALKKSLDRRREKSGTREATPLPRWFEPKRNG